MTAETDQSDEPARARRTPVMLLGSGEYSRELAIVFQRLGAEVIADAPGGEPRPDFVVAVADDVPVDALTAAAETGSTQVFPTARGARLSADRESLRRLAADELGLPSAPFWFAGSLDDLRAVADHAGYPLRVQPAAGHGESLIWGPHEVEAAWRRAGSARVLAETVVEVDFHVTLLAVRSDGPAGPVIDFCAPIGHDAAAGGTTEFWQPQELSPAASDAAKSIAARIVKALGGRGLFGVELMVRGDEVYFCDVSVRPFECALVTLRTQRLSAFELQARAIMGLTTDTIMISPGAARTVDTVPAVGALADALAVPESDVRLFGPGQPGGRSLLGVVVATAADVRTARDRVRQVSAALGKPSRS